MPSSCTEYLHARLAREGALTFAAFMQEALYHPEFGYYGSGRAQIGRRGDFITSVSVGPLFGRLLARQWAEMWARLGQPTEVQLVEEGAHDGRLAADILEALSRQAPECFAATRYLIVEPNPAWESQQRETLAAFPQVVWASTWEAVRPFTGAHLSNELLDAFPVHAVQWANGAWAERYVVASGDGFAWQQGALSSGALAARLAALGGPFPEGYTTEVNLAQEGWLACVASKLLRGWIVVVDYGYERAEYYRPERVEGTLTGYREQKRVRDPLATPGEMDLTAHVDFTALEEQAVALGLTPCALTDQQRFLIRLAQLHFADSAEGPTAETAKEHRQFRTLAHPELMGAAFKVIGFAKGITDQEQLTGFRGVSW